MNSRLALPLVIIAIASFGAWLTTGTHPETRPAVASEFPHPHDSAAVIAHHGSHTDIAIHDMTLHAARNFDAATAQPESYREWPDWSSDWELRWLAFDCDGHIEGVYHAMNKHHPEIRYTVTVTTDADHRTSQDWTRAD